MVAAVQSLAFYCFPLLTGLLLHVMRQRDHDSYLLRRQHERGETARSLHDTIGNDLAYLILRIDHAETEGMPADEHEYQQQLDELRDAASRAMGHTHEVIDSLENHPQRPSDPSHEGSHLADTSIIHRLRYVHPTHRMKARTAASNPAQPIPRKSMPPRSVPGCNR